MQFPLLANASVALSRHQLAIHELLKTVVDQYPEDEALRSGVSRIMDTFEELSAVTLSLAEAVSTAAHDELEAPHA